jgi:hypothetical protein
MRSQFNHPINKLQAICVQNHPPQTHLLWLDFNWKLMFNYCYNLACTVHKSKL